MSLYIAKCQFNHWSGGCCALLGGKNVISSLLPCGMLVEFLFFYFQLLGESDKSFKLRLEAGTFKISRVTCYSLKERKFKFAVQCNNEVSCLLFVSGFVFQRFKFLGILQHNAWYSHQFTAEGTRWQKEMSVTFTFSELFTSPFYKNKK